ncbi:Peptidyl-prolyl isomerase cwc27 [Sparganum proliferum]
MGESKKLKRIGESTQPSFSLSYCKCFNEDPIVHDAPHHPVVELTHHVRESLRTAEFQHDLPQSIAIHRAEGFRQVHECNVKVGPYFLKLLLQVTGGVDHVDGSPVASEFTLTFREKFLFEAAVKTVEGNASEDPPRKFGQRCFTVVITEISILLPHVDLNDFRIIEILRY